MVDQALRIMDIMGHHYPWPTQIIWNLPLASRIS
jgi:hypothetical protein